MNKWISNATPLALAFVSGLATALYLADYI